MREGTALRSSILLTGKPPAAQPTVVDLSIDAACTRFERDGAFATLRPKTARMYRRLMAALRAGLGPERVSSLNALAIERYRRGRLAEAQTHGYGGQVVVNRELSLLSTIIRKTRAWGLHTAADPCGAVKRYRESRGRDRVLTVAEEGRLLAALPEGPMRLATRLALECGGRVASELLPLRWDAVDLDGARLLIVGTDAKNHRPRHLPLSPGMVAALRAQRRHPTSPLVFCTAAGGFLHRYRGHFFAAVKAAGLGGTKVNPHCLRHTFASRLAAATGDLLLVKDLGGWSSLTMVQRYAHLAANRGPAGIAAMLAAREAADPRADLPQMSPQRIGGRRRTP